MAAAILAALTLPPWSIGSSRPSPREQIAAIKWYVRIGEPIYCGGGNGPYVALTFDDGSGPYTAQLLDLLRRAHDEAVDAGVHALNMLEVLWNVDSGDASQASTPTAAEIAQHLTDRIRPGAIVLMHENLMGAPSINALDTVLPAMRARGLIPVTVPELLVLDPPSAEQVSKGSGPCHSAWPPRKA